MLGRSPHPSGVPTPVPSTAVPSPLPTVEPTPVPSTAVPSPLPTARPSAAPSSAPSPLPTAEWPVEPFNCSLHPNPIQVLRLSGEYKVVELDIVTGTYEDIYPLDWLGSYHTNAVGLLEASDGRYFIYTAFFRQFCLFDEHHYWCFPSGSLEVSRPNAGVVIGSTYYYTKSLGELVDHVWTVYEIEGHNPVFSEETAVTFADDLWNGGLADFTYIEEDGGELVDDGDDDRTYLVGDSGLNVAVVMRVRESDGLVDEYAVVPASVNWQDRDPETGNGMFGSAYSYPVTGGDTRVFFASNEGWGLFELTLPLTVPASCFNAGDDTSAHAVCDAATAVFVWRTESAATKDNDGFNCRVPVAIPDTFIPSFEPTTASPSLSRWPSPAPSAALRVALRVALRAAVAGAEQQPLAGAIAIAHGAAVVCAEQQSQRRAFSPSVVDSDSHAVLRAHRSTEPRAVARALGRAERRSERHAVRGAKRAALAVSHTGPLDGVPEPAAVLGAVTGPLDGRALAGTFKQAVGRAFVGAFGRAYRFSDWDPHGFTVEQPERRAEPVAFARADAVSVAAADAVALVAALGRAYAVAFGDAIRRAVAESVERPQSRSQRHTFRRAIAIPERDAVPTPEPSRAPTATPSHAPTACFLDIVDIGTLWTCVAAADCVLAWDYRGDAATCDTVVARVAREDDGSPVGTLGTFPNDGSHTVTLSGDAEANAYVLTLACADGSRGRRPRLARAHVVLLAIRGIGTDFTCAADAPCALSWEYRGDAATCEDVTVTVATSDGAVLASNTIANDESHSVVVSANAEVNTYALTLACADGTCASDSHVLDVSYSMPPSAAPTTPTPTTETPTAAPTTETPSRLPTPAPSRRTPSPSASPVEFVVVWTAAGANVTAPLALNDSACDGVRTADGEVVAEDYIADALAVDRSSISNMTCDENNVTVRSLEARRRLADDAVCRSNRSLFVTHYAFTLVLLPYELVAYGEAGSGTDASYAVVIEETLSALLGNESWLDSVVCDVGVVATATAAPTNAPTLTPTSAPTTAAPSTAAPSTATAAPTSCADWDVCNGGAFQIAVETADVVEDSLAAGGVLRYSPVGYYGGRGVDLVVSGSLTVAHAEYMGKSGSFGQINVADNTTAALLFSLVDAETDGAVVVERFYFTWFDVDRQKDVAKHSEAICVDDDMFDAYVGADDLLVSTSETSCDGMRDMTSTTFAALRPGFLCDNPTDPNALGAVACGDCDQCVSDGLDAYFPVDQSARAVMFVFTCPRSSFEVHLAAPCETCWADRGRNFVFGDESNLCAWPSRAPTTGAPSLQRPPSAPSAAPTSSAPSAASTSSAPSAAPTTAMLPPEAPVNVTLNENTSAVTWVDSGYGGEPSSFMLYDMESNSTNITTEALYTYDARRRLATRKERLLNASWEDLAKVQEKLLARFGRREPQTHDFTLGHRLPCWVRVNIAIVAVNAAGSSAPSEPDSRTLSRCFREPSEPDGDGAPAPAPASGRASDADGGVLVASFGAALCPVLACLIAAAVASVVVAAARRPRARAVPAARAALLGGAVDSACDVLFACDSYGDAVLFPLAIALLAAHALANAPALLRLVRRRRATDSSAFSKNGLLWACTLALATASKLEVAVVLPWARLLTRDRYDVELEDGAVVPAVREDLLRARDKGDAEERKECDGPLRPGARVHVGDKRLPGRVVHVDVDGALDVAYDHGETEICVPPAACRLHALAVDAVVDFDVDGSGRFDKRARVIRKRRPGPGRRALRLPRLAAGRRGPRHDVRGRRGPARAQGLRARARRRRRRRRERCTNAAVLVAIAKAARDVAIRRANAQAAARSRDGRRHGGLDRRRARRLDATKWVDFQFGRPDSDDEPEARGVELQFLRVDFGPDSDDEPAKDVTLESEVASDSDGDDDGAVHCADASDGDDDGAVHCADASDGDDDGAVHCADAGCGGALVACGDAPDDLSIVYDDDRDVGCGGGLVACGDAPEDLVCGGGGFADTPAAAAFSGILEEPPTYLDVQVARSRADRGLPRSFRATIQTRRKMHAERPQ
ncbi:calcineurin-like phosphoesterase [Aureococcus anophagefferens]|nr:calcineurin-like phosphoesterase [Aureococcus anophagefferens]